MANVKTAISIEKPIFEQMDILAKNLELLKQINEAYEDSSETEPMVSMMHPNHYGMVKDQW